MKWFVFFLVRDVRTRDCFDTIAYSFIYYFSYFLTGIDWWVHWIANKCLSFLVLCTAKINTK